MPAARQLAGKHPAAARLLYRRMAEGVVERGSGRRYGYAAREMPHLASPAGRVADEHGIEGHDAFVARLKREHGRKDSFWQLLDAQ